MRLDALKGEGNLNANATNVTEAYELIAALAQELVSLREDADSQGYASPPAGTQTMVFADEGPASIESAPPTVIECPAYRLGHQASKP